MADAALTAEAPLVGAAEQSERPDYLSSFRLIWPYLAGQRVKLAAAVLLATLSVALELVPIYLIYRTIDALVVGDLTTASLLFSVAGALGAVVLGYAVLGLAMMVSHLVAFDALFRLRLALSRHLARLPLGHFQMRQSGEAKKLVIDDPEKLELIIAHGIPEGISAVATWIAVSAWLFAVDWRMALAVILITPVAFVLIVLAMRSGSRFAGAYQAAGQRMNAAVVEYVAGMPVVKIFNRSGEGFREASDAVSAYAALEKEWANAFLPLGGTFYALVLSNVIFIVPVGAFLIAGGGLDLPTLVFFVVLGANYSRPLIKLFNLFHELAHISMGSTLLEEVLSAPPQSDTGKVLPLDGHDVSFDDVRFGYDAHDVLHGVSFTAREGTVTALVGPSGSGKSTIASLIPRFFDPRSGRVSIGGVDVREMGLDQLMDTVAFVFQDTVLFTDTIAGNIRFGKPDASDAEVEAAARAARAHDFITALPQGYETRLGDLGRKLSGGERQRIAIARATLKDAPVIVLDEATAFADPDNEAAIQEAIEALAAGRTLIVVAHRLHTIREAETIVVVADGHIAETGRHDELVAAGGPYARLWDDFMAARQSSLRGTPATVEDRP
ncbi:ATP-binding cassette subfamily B protein [Rhodobium orientis]|uniref:ABC transporter n=1 Tax=Rhodobium orientis TaxID=34017 RepID=A0A327JF87_9HYPH|nr:ABC transporter ATP-binding protein [Rhodobium orientis]MBB4303193.1 ATP-binding cassette subfamily B protein [Rhodobium orientis]MBK5951706.1 ABC transporter [Rhodobium orientis]RAI24999.1 ABC transporter [Rhodobium orientis]